KRRFTDDNGVKKYRNKTSIDLQQVMQHPGGPYGPHFTLCVQKSWRRTSSRASGGPVRPAAQTAPVFWELQRLGSLKSTCVKTIDILANNQNLGLDTSGKST
ncbi:hypothetical protein PV326_014399, partial [Microctonus aethiopoides]